MLEARSAGMTALPSIPVPLAHPQRTLKWCFTAHLKLLKWSLGFSTVAWFLRQLVQREQTSDGHIFMAVFLFFFSFFFLLLLWTYDLALHFETYFVFILHNANQMTTQMVIQSVCKNMYKQNKCNK